MSHNCQNLVLTCMDFRFRATHDKYIASLGEADRVALAGSAKALVDVDTRETVLKQIKLANQLHGVKEIYLVDHEDCGAYGGKKAVDSDEEELKVHRENSKQAQSLINEIFPELKVYSKFAKLNGEVIDL